MSKTDNNINATPQSSHTRDGESLWHPTPIEWAETQLHYLLAHVIGGDWGKDIEYNDDTFIDVMCIRGTEFRHWDTQHGKTAVPRKIKPSSLASRKLQIGDILIEISGGGPDQPVGRTVLITKKALSNFCDKPAVCTNFLRLARPTELIVSTYLNYYLQYFYKSGEVTKYQGGSNNLRNLKFKEYETITTPLPPLAEQKVIADKLDELLAQVDTLKARLDAIPAILKRFRQSVLAAAVSGKLTEEWRGNNPLSNTKELIENLGNERRKVLQQEITQGNKETARLLKKIQSHAPKFPNETLPTSWEWTTFMQAMERVVDCHNKTAPYINDGIPLIRTTDIRDGKISLDGAKYISQETYDYWSRRCPPKQGDIIFTREAPMGEAGIIPKGVTLCMGQRMMLLRPMPAFINAEYVLLNIQSLQFQHRMSKQAIGTGVKHLRVADVEALPFPLPPQDEQTEIVRRVEQLFIYADQVEQQVKNAQARVNQLTQSILAKAFRGELTEQWRQDNPELISGDNSAAALLERIKAERAATKPTKKTRGKKKT